MFSLVLVIALFASATSAFGVATRRYTRVSVSGDTYALAGLFLVDGVTHGLLGTSRNDGDTWSLGLTPGAFWGAAAWPDGPVWGSMTLNRGLWTGDRAAEIDYKSPPNGPIYEWRDVAYDGSAAIAVGNRTHADWGEPAQPGTIWRSSNGGDTWTEELRAPDYAPQPPDYTVPPQAAAVLEAVDAVPGLAVAVGTEYPQEDFNYFGTPKQALIYSSTDGGLTWSQQSAGATLRLLDVDVVSSGPTGVVWALGTGKRVFRSLDGGQTWSNWVAPNDFSAGNLGATTYFANSIAGVDATHAYIAGTNGKIGYVSDPTLVLSPPTNWSFHTLAGLPTLNGIAARDATHAVAVGDNGLILNTIAGMGGWQAKNTATTPALAVTAPTGGFTLGAGSVNVAGTSSDTGLGVAQVQLRIKRSDAKYWDGDSWEAPARWLRASTSSSWANWAYNWTDDGSSKPGTHTVEISVRAINGNGTVSAIVPVASAKSSTSVLPIVPSIVPYTGATVSAKVLSKTGQPILGGGPMNLYRMSGTSALLVKSGIMPNYGGVYSYKLAPVNKTRYRWTYAGNTSFTGSSAYFYVTPSVRLYRPKASRSSSIFTVTTYISPRHSSRAVRVYAYRYSGGKWSTTPYKYAYATGYAYTSTTTRMVAKLSLPRGTWRFRAYAPADSYHAYTWSGYSVTYKY